MTKMDELKKLQETRERVRIIFNDTIGNLRFLCEQTLGTNKLPLLDKLSKEYDALLVNKCTQDINTFIANAYKIGNETNEQTNT